MFDPDAIDDSGDAAAVITATHRLTLDAARPELIDDDVEFVFGLTVPKGDDHRIIDLEKYAPAPRRKMARPTFTTTESFARYVNTHRTAGTTLYANPDLVSVCAILDDHDTAGPHHREHVASLRLTQTPGCLRWTEAHGSYLDQEAFAQLIEDGLTEIARPEGAELLEIAQSIHATKSAAFRSDRRLTNGRVQFQWVESLDATAGENGDLQIPETITLVFEPFYGAEKVQIDARFRYRINNGKLTLGFWLIRHEEQLRDAFAAEMERLEDLIEAPADAVNTPLFVLWGTA